MLRSPAWGLRPCIAAVVVFSTSFESKPLMQMSCRGITNTAVLQGPCTQCYVTCVQRMFCRYTNQLPESRAGALLKDQGATAVRTEHRKVFYAHSATGPLASPASRDIPWTGTRSPCRSSEAPGGFATAFGTCCSRTRPVSVPRWPECTLWPWKQGNAGAKQWRGPTCTLQSPARGGCTGAGCASPSGARIPSNGNKCQTQPYTSSAAEPLSPGVRSPSSSAPPSIVAAPGPRLRSATRQRYLSALGCLGSPRLKASTLLAATGSRKAVQWLCSARGPALTGRGLRN